MAPLTPIAICFLATLTAFSPGGIRKSTFSHGAVLGVHVNASLSPYPSFPPSLSLSSLLQQAPTQGFGTALTRSAWAENNKATKISHFCGADLLAWLSMSLSLCIMKDGLMTSDHSASFSKIHKSMCSEPYYNPRLSWKCCPLSLLLTAWRTGSSFSSFTLQFSRTHKFDIFVMVLSSSMGEVVMRRITVLPADPVWPYWALEYLLLLSL